LTDVSSFRHKKRREDPLLHDTTSLICCMEILFLNWLPLLLAWTTAFLSTPFLLCCNKMWVIDFLYLLVVFTLIGLWFIHFFLSLVTYRQPLPLQLCDVSHNLLMQSWMWEILLQAHILSMGGAALTDSSCLGESYPPSQIHQSRFRSWDCLLGTVIYSLGDSSLSLPPPLSKLFCVENFLLPWELSGQLPVASSLIYNLDYSAVCFKISS
jgi:hypothetical protein